jgi:site-specific recombinase XerD
MPDFVQDATKEARHEARDHCLLLPMSRHGLRVSEACGLVLSQVGTESRVLHVKRLKDGLSTTHPLRGGRATRHQDLAGRAHSYVAARSAK